LIPVVTASEMSAIDRETIRGHVPGIDLMERAGKGVADELLRYAKPPKTSRIVIVCGRGNNGGDGLVVSRLLRRKGYRPKTYLLGGSSEITGDALTNLRRCRKAGITIRETDSKTGKAMAALVDDLAKADLIVDAVFGTGFSGIPKGQAQDVINEINASPAIKVAVDIPSGVDSSTGRATVAVEADLTVTMALPKRGHLLLPGKALTGELVIHDIGVPPEVVVQANPDTFVLGRNDVQTVLPVRPPEAHKWSCGFVAAMCGSTGYTGAATLACLSALRVGCGLVTLAIPRSLNTIMETKLTEVMTLPVDETPEGTLAVKARKHLRDLIDRADAVAIGPGLSRDAETIRLLRGLVPGVGKPCVLDADGINAFAGQSRKLRTLGFPLVITPHAGEASRLFGVDKDDILAAPVDFARNAAENLGLVMVLKGAPTVIAGPDGDVFINPTGNQGLATAGSGDVLTGIIAGLLAQRVPALEAASAGCYIHGLTSDILFEEIGYYGFLAGDLSDTIPQALANILLG
jgi:hydroxyethylthiazole kinase-like uncharacterized protein yjeF